jgi:hypothetical protein
MKKILIITVFAFFLFSAISAHAWLFYSKPEFRGKVIDAETKQPIEGAVAVVVYYKWNFGGPGGGSSLPFNAKETLTDNNGEFYFPSYKTLIGPLSRVSYASFIIFKPGYMSINGIEGIKMPTEKYFAIEKDMIGKEGELNYIDPHLYDPSPVTWKGLMGIVEMKKAKTFEERRLGVPDTPFHYTSKELPLLFKAIRQDDIERGVEVR